MEITYRKPTSADGSAVHTLISQCPPLDINSLYCNLLQCTDFAETSIVAEDAQGEVVGFISGYIPAQRLDTLFVWQVALSSKCRGQGVASQMLTRLFHRNENLRFMETTISPSNGASQKLFERFFKAHHMHFETSVLFARDVHFDGEHEDEVLYRAGPTKQFTPILAG